MDEKQRSTFDIFVPFLTPVDTLTNSAVMERVQSNNRMTHFGTKFIGSLSTLDTNLRTSYNKKLLGMGAKASFIGGSGQSVGSGLATYSIYHRQESIV